MLFSYRAKYLAFALLIILASLVAWDYFFWSGRYPPNCYIEKIDVSGLSKFEVLQKLKSVNVDQVVIQPIMFELEGDILTYKPSEIGVYVSPRKTVNNTTGTSYRSNYFVDLSRRMIGGYKKQVIPLSLVVDRDAFKAFLEGLANDVDVPTKEATFRLYDDRYVITHERAGKKLDIQASMNNLEAALADNERLSVIAVSVLSPRVRAKSLVKYPPKYLLSEYTTYYGSHDSPNRVHNIKVATNRLNNRIVNSGEVFSLLDALGEFTSQHGFREAFVLYNGELEPQYGGGSCQIASTLYNAALLAGLDILERSNHGIYFTIYPLGRDATIYSGSKDLKIGNNTNHPIYIKATATDRKVSYMIYGTPTARRITFSRPMIFFDGERVKSYDVTSEEAKEKINDALLSGRPFSTYVKVRMSEAGLIREKMIKSHYKMTGDKENVKIVRPEPQ